MRNKIFLFLLLLTAALPLSAQDLKVRSMVFAPMEQTANLAENLHKDLNGDYGGLVRVMLATPGATFEGWVLHQEKHNASEYWVFMAKGSSRMKVIVPGFLPLEVNFKDYEDCVIQSKCTYVLTITVPQTGNVPVDDGMRYLGLSVEPKNATVLVDNMAQVLDNGSVVVSLPQGTHRYQVSAPGYATEEGTVELKDEKKNLEIKLKSLLATLRVECATNGAQVFVNGQSKGTAPWSGTYPAGNYKVEARLDGYRTNTQNITLKDSEQRTLQIPALDMIMGILDVKVTPVNAEIFVDGKKVGTTPDVFRNIQIGNHRVEIRKDGFEPLTQTVTINENQQTPLSGALKEKPSSQVLFELGEDYYNGRNGKKKNYNKAVEYYRQAAEEGHATAQCNLGNCYYNGEGVAKDYKQAVNWYRKAAEQEYAIAQRHLGCCYRDGTGVSQDYFKAVEWFRKATEMGNASAMNSLGVCYANGKGVSKNYTKAVELFRKAAELGNANAYNWLGDCYEKGNGVKKDIEQAVRYYRMGAEQGEDFSKKALRRLGRK